MKFQAFEILPDGLCEDARVPLTDVGFRFGLHLFETIAVVEGHWLFFESHLKILTASATAHGFRLHPTCNQWLYRLPGVVEFQNGIARIFWTAGDAGFGQPPAEGRLFLLLEAQEIPRAASMVLLAKTPANASICTNGLKSGNYWGNQEAMRFARASGASECILCIRDGTVSSCSAANIFLYSHGRWITPPLESGCRNGVVRQWLLRNKFAEEDPFDFSQLCEQDRFLVTNSRLGVCPAVFAGPAAADWKDFPATPILDYFARLSQDAGGFSES